MRLLLLMLMGRERSARIASMYATVIRLSNENVCVHRASSVVENQPKEYMESRFNQSYEGCAVG